MSRRVCGRGISKQLFNILEKIRDVDRLQSPRLQARLFEMHPELSFTMLAGAPMRSNKRTAAGRAERLAALRSTFGDGDPHRSSRRPPGRNGTTCSMPWSGRGPHAVTSRGPTSTSAANWTSGACGWR